MKTVVTVTESIAGLVTQPLFFMSFCGVMHVVCGVFRR